MAAKSLFSSNNSNPNSPTLCLQIHPFSIILPTIVFSIFLFLLPLYIFIIHHCLQQWMKKSSSSSSAAAMSHSDCFTYNMVLMELLAVVAHVVFFTRHSHNQDLVLLVGYLGNFSWMGKMLLQLLTCVGRYLAVVHPITYMRLKNRKGTRIRNATIVCVWLISGMSYTPEVEYFGTCILALSLAAVCFCSVSVLVVLVRPGPGEQGGNRQWADPSKKRAFYTILAILGVLVLKLSGDLVNGFQDKLVADVLCVFEVYSTFLHLPNSLVLPLLFLLKHGRSIKQ